VAPSARRGRRCGIGNGVFKTGAPCDISLSPPRSGAADSASGYGIGNESTTRRRLLSIPFGALNHKAVAFGQQNPQPLATRSESNATIVCSDRT
jgi:hypothetical protein